MTDKKKKPVESTLKQDVDAAIDKAATKNLEEKQAEHLDQLAATLVAEEITTKAVEKLKAESVKAIPKLAKKILNSTLSGTKQLEHDIADFDSAPRLKKVTDWLHDTTPGVELSKIWDGVDPLQLINTAVVTVGNKVFLPVGNPIKSDRLGRDCNFEATGNSPQMDWRIQTQLNNLSTPVDLNRFVIKLGEKVIDLYLSADCVFAIDDNFYGFHGESSTNLTVGISAKFNNVTLNKNNIVIGYDVTNAGLKDAILVNVDPKKHKTRSYGYPRHVDDRFCTNNWSEARRYNITNATVNNTEVVNSDLEYGQYIKSYINRCILVSGVKGISVTDSNLTSLEVTAVKRIAISLSRLTGRVTCNDSVIIEGLKANDLFISDAPISVEINSQFGWTCVDWMNDTSVRFFTAGNDKLLMSVPYQYIKDDRQKWLEIPIRWEDYELAKDRPGYHGYGMGMNSLQLSGKLAFRRNGKVLDRPDMIQRAFVEFLEGSIESRLRVLALIRSIADNAQTVIPKRPGYLDDCPF